MVYYSGVYYYQSPLYLDVCSFNKPRILGNSKFSVFTYWLILLQQEKHPKNNKKETKIWLAALWLILTN